MWITGVIAKFKSGQIAQLVEQRIENPCVGSSILPLATTNRILAVIFLSNAVYPNLQDPSLARLLAMFRACLVSTAVYPNCIEATEFWGYVWGILEIPPKKYPQMPLTDRQIKNAKPADKAYKLTDGSGLYLQVTPAGGKLWRFDYAIANKRKTLSIGKYPLISLLEVREAAESTRRLLAAGQDPGEAKKQAKQERIAALQNTFRNLAAEWHEHQHAGWTAGHAAKVWRSFEVDILPAFGRLPIAEIRIKDVKALRRQPACY